MVSRCWMLDARKMDGLSKIGKYKYYRTLRRERVSVCERVEKRERECVCVRVSEECKG